MFGKLYIKWLSSSTFAETNCISNTYVIPGFFFLCKNTLKKPKTSKLPSPKGTSLSRRGSNFLTKGALSSQKGTFSWQTGMHLINFMSLSEAVRQLSNAARYLSIKNCFRFKEKRHLVGMTIFTSLTKIFNTLNKYETLITIKKQVYGRI